MSVIDKARDLLERDQHSECFEVLTAEITSLAIQLGEALVRENNLIAALERQLLDIYTYDEVLNIARKALATNEQVSHVGE